jgi:hypothetical protein
MTIHKPSFPARQIYSPLFNLPGTYLIRFALHSAVLALSSLLSSSAKLWLIAPWRWVEIDLPPAFKVA